MDINTIILLVELELRTTKIFGFRILQVKWMKEWCKYIPSNWVIYKWIRFFQSRHKGVATNCLQNSIDPIRHCLDKIHFISFISVFNNFAASKIIFSFPPFGWLNLCLLETFCNILALVLWKVTIFGSPLNSFNFH